MSRPKRLSGCTYIGPARYFLTFCTRSRRKAFTDADTANETLSLIRHTAQVEEFAILAYCAMSDHLHLLVEGTSNSCDLRRFAKLAKQRSGAAHALKTRKPLWQEGFYERVMRADQDAKAFARYILENPVRASLVSHPSEYRFCGSDVWTLQELYESVERLPGPKDPAYIR